MKYEADRRFFGLQVRECCPEMVPTDRSEVVPALVPPARKEKHQGRVCEG